MKDGGPAYPQTVRGKFNQHNDGTSDWTPKFIRYVTLDWFAGRALTGYMSGNVDSTTKRIASDVYAIADAMLAERER